MADLFERRAASALNSELTQLLVDVGRRMNFDVVTEYAVGGGRLDVVWAWTPPTPIPGLDGSLPVVAFEIESSWRTRKHIKGDLLNLQDAAVSLGVIVLAGADARDDSLRRFANSLVDRPGARVLVWTDDHVRALAAGQETPTPIAEATAGSTHAASRATTASVDHGVQHVGKYRPLWAWLRSHEPRPVRVEFVDIEKVLGFPLPDSCREHQAHWFSHEGSAVARAIIDAGWHATRVNLAEQSVTLVPGPPTSRR